MGRVVVDWLSVIGTTEVVYSLHHAIGRIPEVRSAHEGEVFDHNPKCSSPDQPRRTRPRLSSKAAVRSCAGGGEPFFCGDPMPAERSLLRVAHTLAAFGVFIARLRSRLVGGFGCSAQRDRGHNCRTTF